MQLLNAVSTARKQGRDQDDRVPALLRAVAQLVASGRPLDEVHDGQNSITLQPKAPVGTAMPLEGPLDMFGANTAPATVSAAQLAGTTAAVQADGAKGSAAPSTLPSRAEPENLLDAVLADPSAEPVCSASSLYPEAAAVLERAGLHRVPWERDEVTGEEFVERRVGTAG